WARAEEARSTPVTASFQVIPSGARDPELAALRTSSGSKTPRVRERFPTAGGLPSVVGSVAPLLGMTGLFARERGAIRLTAFPPAVRPRSAREPRERPRAGAAGAPPRACRVT